MTSAPVLALRFVLAMAILAVGPYLVWDLLRAVGRLDAAPGTPAHYEASMLATVAACAAVGVFAGLQHVACSWRPVRLGSVLASYLPFALGWGLLLIAYLAVARWCGTPVPVQTGLEYLANSDLMRPGFWVVVLAVCVGAPLAEEIVFRGYLLGALQQVVPAWLAIGITAAAFGAVHGLPYALPIAVLGCLFGWLRVRHGSLLPSMLAHAVHNALIVLVTVSWPESIALLYHS